jgi:hypothetical protein
VSIWDLQEFISLSAHPRVIVYNFDQYTLGSETRKPTRLVTFLSPSRVSLQMRPRNQGVARHRLARSGTYIVSTSPTTSGPPPRSRARHEGRICVFEGHDSKRGTLARDTYIRLASRSDHQAVGHSKFPEASLQVQQGREGGCEQSMRQGYAQSTEVVITLPELRLDGQPEGNLLHSCRGVPR